MKCMKCNKNEANVYISTNINGKIKKEYLCEECAKDIDMRKFMQMDRMLARMFNSNSMLDMSNILTPSSKSFFATDDWFTDNMFRDVIMLNDMARKLDFDIPLKNGEEDTVRIKEENIIDKKIKEKKDNNIEDLQYELNKAIKEERYEDAAVLRDRINGKNKQGGI